MLTLDIPLPPDNATGLRVGRGRLNWCLSYRVPDMFVPNDFVWVDVGGWPSIRLAGYAYAEMVERLRLYKVLTSAP